MGLGYEKEARVMGKKVDFLLADINTILEFDGDFHINYQRRDVTLHTGMRNALYLYAGYGVVVVNVFDFNLHRSKDQLKQLL